MIRIAVLPLVFLLLTPASAASRSSYVDDYALASCLITQDASPALREEGYRLVSIILHQTGTTAVTWRTLDAAVKKVLARTPMVMVHVDAPVDQATQPAPLATCLRVVDDRAVRATMAKLKSRRSGGR